MRWVIQDWTGKRKFPDREFKRFQDGWDFLMGQFESDEDLGEFYVVER